MARSGQYVSLLAVKYWLPAIHCFIQLALNLSPPPSHPAMHAAASPRPPQGPHAWQLAASCCRQRSSTVIIVLMLYGGRSLTQHSDSVGRRFCWAQAESATFSKFQPVCAILRYELLAGDPSTPTSKESPRQGAFNGPIKFS